MDSASVLQDTMAIGVKKVSHFKHSIIIIIIIMKLPLNIVCETGCDAGRYGRGCTKLCECDGASCDPATGQCFCSPGKTGEHCEKGIHTHTFTDMSTPYFTL